MSRTVLICFEKVVYHRPDLSPKQFGMKEVNTSVLRPLIELDIHARTGQKGINWETHRKYGLYKKMWENRASCLITESVEEGPGSPLSDGNYLLIGN